MPNFYDIQEIKNKIIHGETLEEIKKIPDNSIDMVISSPPYYGLRSYLPNGHPDKLKEIGLENSFEEYLKKILLITNEIKRVLKNSGSFWLNMGDCFGGSGMGISYVGHTKGPNSILPDNLNYMPAVGHSRGKFDKCMLMQPERLAIKMIDEQGWILRNKIKWCKQILVKKTSTILGDNYVLRKDLTKKQKEYVLKELVKYNLI